MQNRPIEQAMLYDPASKNRDAARFKKVDQQQYTIVEKQLQLAKKILNDEIQKQVQ
ncbi:hypothetical protein KHA80_20980 [Anaerobacillus sp. HL2]|nr:hypothetical protein KHA80_20980 [Anaerobacillus sp. HL2]